MTRTRVIAALIMAPTAITAILLLPTPWMAAVAAAVVLAALWEWLKLAGIDDSLPRTVLLLLTLLLMVLLVWGSRGEAGFSPVLFQIATLAGIVGWLLSLAWLWRPAFGAGRGSWSQVLKLGAGTLAALSAWCALCLIHSDNFAALGGGGDPRAHRWLLVALALVWAADTGAYFTGRHLGRRKLAPSISPNKTVEGALGGVLAGLATALAFGLLAGASAGQLPALALAAVVAVLASIVGDLVESLLKRQAGVKDSGGLIPGHGGVLDRIDGVLAALPAFAIAKDILGF